VSVSTTTEIRNVFADEWEELYPQIDGWRANYRRLIPPGHQLGVTLYELQPGQTQCPYHFHHGADELLLVLRGRPTLRTPDGERQLEPGDFAHFPKGPAGAHHVVNRTGEPARYVVGSTFASPEVCEYPDSGKMAAFSREASSRGEQLRTVHRFDDEVDYFNGEEPRA
jgi:uncharacterized cupin superfamily protein